MTNPRTEQQQQYAIGVVMALGAALLSSTAGLAIRFIEESEGWDILLVRSLGYFLFMACYAGFTRRMSFWRSLRETGFYTILGALATTASQICFIFAMLKTTVATVVLTMSATPAVTAVLAFIILGERLRKSSIFVVVAATMGVLIIALGDFAGRDPTGLVLACISCICFSFMLICVKMQNDGGAIKIFLWSSVFTLITALIIKPGFQGSPADFSLCLYLGVVSIGVQHVFIAMALRRVEATLVGLLSRAQAIFGPIWVALFVSEIPSSATVIGGAIVFLALIAEGVLGILHHKRAENALEHM